MIEKGVMRVKFVFLILHYKNDDVTKQCIESLIQCFGTLQMEIIVEIMLRTMAVMRNCCNVMGMPRIFIFYITGKTLGMQLVITLVFSMQRKC